MKLLLTSSGLDSQKAKKEFLKLLNKPIGKTKVLMIFGVKNDEEMFYVNESKNELIELGINKLNILNANISDDISSGDFNDFDVIYVCGGNTYYILDRLRKTGFDELIINSVNKGILYIGVSAGSIIAGKDIEIAGWGSEGDENDIGLKDLRGFNFTDIAIFPHYEDRLKKEVDEFSKKVNYPVKVLKNGEFIVVN